MKMEDDYFPNEQELIFWFQKLDICPFSPLLSSSACKQHLSVQRGVRSQTRSRHRGGRTWRLRPPSEGMAEEDTGAVSGLMT